MARRLAWIEAARTFNCALVVLAHINFYTRAGVETWWPGGYFSVPLLSLAVPTFFAVAGFAIDHSAAENAHSSRMMLKRFPRLLVPFVVWNALTLLAMRSTADTTTDIVVQILTGTWHLYFIFALLQLLLLYALFAPAMNSGKAKVVIAAALGLTCISYAAAEVALRLYGSTNELSDPGLRKLFPFWSGFFAIGMLFRRGYFQFDRRSWIVLAVLLTASFGVYVLDLKFEDSTFEFTPLKQILAGGLPFQALGAITMLAILRKLDRSRVVTVLGRWGRDTYGIYLSHFPIALYAREDIGFGFVGVATITIVLSLTLAAISYYTVELWARRLRDWPRRKSASVSVVEPT